MKKLLLLFTITISYLTGFSQIQTQANVALFSLNPSYYNPAFAGLSESNLNLTIISRKDWVRLDNLSINNNNPWSSLATIDKRFDEKKLGVSANLSNVRVDDYNIADVQLNGAYHLPLGGEKKLSFGIKVGFANFTGLKPFLQDPTDVTFDPYKLGKADNRIFTFIPKFGFGMVYKTENFFAGVSLPDLYTYDKQSVLYPQRGGFNSFTNRNITANVGYKLSLNEDYFLQPIALVRVIPGNNIKTDLSLNIGKNEAYWGGVIYSHETSMAAMAGFVLNGRMKLNYAFNYYTAISATSHEIGLYWDLEDAF